MLVYDNGVHLIKDSNRDSLSQMSELYLFLLQNIWSACSCMVNLCSTRFFVCCYNLNKLSSKQPKCENFTIVDNAVLRSNVPTQYTALHRMYNIILLHCIASRRFIQQLIWIAFAFLFGTSYVSFLISMIRLSFDMHTWALSIALKHKHIYWISNKFVYATKSKWKIQKITKSDGN